MINRERLVLAIQALKSGRYPQGQGRLCLLDPGTYEPVGYCCLGVLTEVAMANGLELDVSRVGCVREYAMLGAWNAYSTQTVLLSAVQKWYGLNEDDPMLIGPGGHCEAASVWNDKSGKTLEEIGDMFEYTFLRMFGEEQ